MRIFETGATRSSDEGKPEYAGYLHPEVIRAYGLYMLKHQTQEDGKRRDCRNHKKGMPTQAYMQSMFRHFLEVWTYNEDMLKGYEDHSSDVIDSLMALMFNVMGYAHNILEGTDIGKEGA